MTEPELKMMNNKKKKEKEKSSIEKNEIKETKEIKETIKELSLDTKTEVKTEEKKKIKYYYDIICPECKTTAIIDINDDNEKHCDFNILNCKNFHFLKKIKLQ